MRIYRATNVSEKLVQGVANLLLQLSSNATAPTFEEMEKLLADENYHLLIAEIDGEIAGMLSLVIVNIPTGRKTWIEDVVVDEAMRGRSLGRLLVEKAVAHAHTLGPGSLMLTSRPSREAANALYRSCGFTFKETNNYTMIIDAEKTGQD